MRSFQKKQVLLWSVLFILIVALSFGIGYSIANSSKKNDTNEKENTNEEVKKDETEDEEIQARISEERIAFIEDKNIWVMDSDGSNKKQITTDGGESLDLPIAIPVNYFSVIWKEPAVVSYSRCHSICEIISYDLDTDVETIHSGATESEQTQTLAHGWGVMNNTPTLVYISFSKDQDSFSNKIYAWSESLGKREIYSYDYQYGRGGSANDELSVKFSNDGKFVSVLNTYASGDDEQLVVFNTSNWSVKLETNATGHAFWGNDKLLFGKFESDKVALYELVLNGNSPASLFLADSVTPRYVFNNRLTGSYGGPLVEVKLLPIPELQYPGEILSNAELISNGRVFIGQELVSNEIANYYSGITKYEVTSDGVVMNVLSENATQYSIER